MDPKVVVVMGWKLQLPRKSRFSLFPF